MSTKKQRGPGRAAATVPAADGRSLTGRRTTRSRAATVGGIALGLTAASLAGMPAQAIDSNPPTGPGNVEIFTKRDMVAIEGYSEYAGKKAQFTVLRGGEVIGSAIGTVDSTGFLETNHPGGICWGAGTDLKVTPDIRGGDEVRVDFLGTGTPNKWDGATAKTNEITEVKRIEEGHKLVISGTFGPDVDMPGSDLVADPGKFGVEIVNPDMRGGTSAVGERAIGWPVEAGEVTPGYVVSGGITSGAEGTGGTFAVTYDFELASDLDLAEAGEAVSLAWQQDPDPALGDIEFQAGLTLDEFYEAAGPGMGGCPAGPQELRPDAPTVATAKGAANGSVHVTWQNGTTQPAAAKITDYTVTAIRPFGEGWGGGVVRVPAGQNSATVIGLTPNEIYDIEIQARSDSGDSKPMVMRVRTVDHTPAVVEANTAAPLNADGKTYSRPLVTSLVENGPDFGVHLDAVGAVAGARIYYTTDGSAPSESSTPYEVGEPLQIRTDTLVRWVVFDAGNIKGEVGQKLFDIEQSNAPDAPAAPAAEAGDAFANVTFPTIPNAIAYRVQAYTGDVKVGTPLGVPLIEGASTLTRKMPNLVNGTEYSFTVAVRVGNVWSNESGKSNVVTPTAAPKANAGPDQTVLRGRKFTLDASASHQATSYQWTQIRPAPANNGGFPQDPIVDLDPVKAGAQAVSPAGTEPTKELTFPLLTTPTSDHNLRFRLTATHGDGTVTTIDTVDIVGQADSVTADEVRWRTGDEIGGTGSQENATVTMLNGSPTATQIGQFLITNGEWEYPSGTPGLLNGKIYVWSNYGFTGYITTTN